MEFSERVLVLQIGKFKEADLWVRLLSPTRGIFSAFAFGGSRSRRRFVGCLDTFNEISVRVASTNRGAYLALQEGVLIKGVSRLRKDWARFGMAVNCVRFLQSFGIGPEGAESAHHLMQKTLCLLEEEENVPRLLPQLFRARLAFDQGYALNITCCGKCGRPLPTEGVTFALQEGLLLCRHCSSGIAGQRFFLSGETLRCVEGIKERSPDEWSGIGISSRAQREFAGMMDAFIQYHVGIVWENGRFVKQ